MFRDYPYLFDGTPDNEIRYLKKFATTKVAVIFAWLAAAGYDIDRFFYFRGMVLLAEYRGHGIGRTFCDHREAYVRSRGYSHSAFCSVIRPANHPLKPANYWPLDGFWLKRGYRKVEHLVVSVAWKDVDEDQETEHPMQFWMREL